jgi:hypothetical protein
VPLHGAQRRPCNETPTGGREVRPRSRSGDVTVYRYLHHVERSRVHAVVVIPDAAGDSQTAPTTCTPACCDVRRRGVRSVELADRKLPPVSNEARKKRLSLAGRGRRAAPGEGGLRRGSTFDPLPHHSSTPSPYPGRGRGVDVAWCGGVTVCTSQLHGREKTPLPSRERPARSAG